MDLTLINRKEEQALPAVSSLTAEAKSPTLNLPLNRTAKRRCVLDIELLPGGRR
jgi:hypothetical protein